MSDDKGYIRGSTVTLRIEFQAPETSVPVTPTSVTLDALILGGTTVISNSNLFAAVSPGTYETSLDTTSFQAGTYTWRFLAVDSSGNKLYGEDSFVLIAKTGPGG